ncbi:unnamed protein product [Oikopleura dioica]|uniref:Uncharacterized protein n=1 Tax=Oikopleura dioica TaxID=34765 RepID=E4XF32_OIKDI|nr:unnamed protein product [Oikopleura dioica]
MALHLTPRPLKIFELTFQH